MPQPQPLYDAAWFEERTANDRREAQQAFNALRDAFTDTTVSYDDDVVKQIVAHVEMLTQTTQKAEAEVFALERCLVENTEKVEKAVLALVEAAVKQEDTEAKALSVAEAEAEEEYAKQAVYDAKDVVFERGDAVIATLNSPFELQGINKKIELNKFKPRCYKPMSIATQSLRSLVTWISKNMRTAILRDWACILKEDWRKIDSHHRKLKEAHREIFACTTLWNRARKPATDSFAQFVKLGRPPIGKRGINRSSPNWVADRLNRLTEAQADVAWKGRVSVIAKSGSQPLRATTESDAVTIARREWAEAQPAVPAASGPRAGTKRRKTAETYVTVTVNLDRDGPSRIATGVGYFDHMLEQVARHGGIALDVTVEGDLHIDAHHTIEDVCLTFGEALREALRDKRGLARFGFELPMDETRAAVWIDLSGRPYAKFEGEIPGESVGEFPVEMTGHAFRSIAESLGAAIHVKVEGENAHHMVEACFKAFGRALRAAVRVEGEALPSTKGMLA